MFASIASRYGRWRRVRDTRRQLEALDDRTLKDVGLHRRFDDTASQRAMLRTLGLR